MKIFKFLLIYILLNVSFYTFSANIEFEKFLQQTPKSLFYKSIEEFFDCFKDFLDQLSRQQTISILTIQGPCLILEKIDFDILSFINLNAKELNNNNECLNFTTYNIAANNTHKEYCLILLRTNNKNEIKNIINCYCQILSKIQNNWLKEYSRKKDVCILTRMISLPFEKQLVDLLVEKFDLTDKVKVEDERVIDSESDLEYLRLKLSIQKEFIDEVLTAFNFNIAYKTKKDKERLEKFTDRLKANLKTTNYLPDVLNDIIVNFVNIESYLLKFSSPEIDKFLQTPVTKPVTRQSLKRKIIEQ